MYTSEILAEAGCPVFTVSHPMLDDSPPLCIKAESPEAAWRAVQSKVAALWAVSCPGGQAVGVQASATVALHPAARRAGLRILQDRNELLLFGFGPTVYDWIEDLSGASNCSKYKCVVLLF
jgi:hypothetical protein